MNNREGNILNLIKKESSKCKFIEERLTRSPTVRMNEGKKMQNL